MGNTTDTTEHLTVDQIITAVYASMVPEGDPDDHDMLVRLADEILSLRSENGELREAVRLAENWLHDEDLTPGRAHGARREFRFALDQLRQTWPRPVAPR